MGVDYAIRQRRALPFTVYKLRLTQYTFRGFKNLTNSTRRDKHAHVLTVVIPHEPFNSAVRNGTAGDTLKKILDDTKPEAVYFTEQDGHRGAILAINVDDSSQIPALAEPGFLHFNADCKFRIAMTPEDLEKAGLAEIAKKWG